MGRPQNRVRETRTNLGLTRPALARVLGVSSKHILTIETGRNAPSLSVLLDLADAFECSIDDLYPRELRRERASVIRSRYLEEVSAKNSAATA